MDSDKNETLAKARALERAVRRHGDIDAMARLGAMMVVEDVFASQRMRGVQFLNRAIKQGRHPHAMYCLAKFFIDKQVNGAASLAAPLLERALRLDERPEVLHRLGLLYFYGEGVRKDAAHAAGLFERALRLEQDPYLMECLAIALLQAPSMHQHRRRALKLYRKAIDMTADPLVMNRLGLQYSNGTCVLKPNASKARKWFMRSLNRCDDAAPRANLALLMLDGDADEDDVTQAIRLLEDSLEKEQHELIMLKLADLYVKRSVDVERGVNLYEAAALRFDSKAARFKFLHNLLGCRAATPDNRARVHDFCLEDVEKNGNRDSFVLMAQVRWSVSERRLALRILDLLQWTRHGVFSLMLRYDLSLHPGGRKRARALMETFDSRIEDVCFSDAVILSERECAADRLRALECFERERTVRGVEAYSFLLPYARRCRFDLPFHGGLECVSNAMRVYTCMADVACLNLASLLLETEGRQHECVGVLEGLMDGNLRLLGQLNCAYVLMNGVAGVQRDWESGMQMLRDAVSETNDVSARAMLGNALAQQKGASDEDVERGWRLWKGVQEEADGEELRRLGRLVCRSSEQKWAQLRDAH